MPLKTLLELKMPMGGNPMDTALAQLSFWNGQCLWRRSDGWWLWDTIVFDKTMDKASGTWSFWIEQWVWETVLLERTIPMGGNTMDNTYGRKLHWWTMSMGGNPMEATFGRRSCWNGQYLWRQSYQKYLWEMILIEWTMHMGDNLNAVGWGRGVA